MTTGGRLPGLDHEPAAGPTRALAVFCHGGTVASVQPPKERALSLLRMRAIEQFVRASAAERGGAPTWLPTPWAAGNGVAS